MGIISIVIGLFQAAFYGWIGAVIAIAGIILGAIARKRDRIAMYGFVRSIAGAVICIVARICLLNQLLVR